MEHYEARKHKEEIDARISVLRQFGEDGAVWGYDYSHMKGSDSQRRQPPSHLQGVDMLASLISEFTHQFPFARRRVEK